MSNHPKEQTCASRCYATIVADPPWNFQAVPTTRLPLGASHDGRKTHMPYSCLSVDEIKALPVADLADTDAHLYLWTLNAYIEESYAIARAWGFRPSTLLMWAKTPMGISGGGAWTSNVEFILFARRGTLATKRRWDTRWFNWPRTTVHSRKPDAFLDMVEATSPGPYLELFARRQRLGWDTWGNEALNHVEVAA